MLKTIIGVLALTTTLPVAAQDSRVVRYDDLNLAVQAGQDRLERRIDAAARSVCRAEAGRIADLRENARSRACIKEATARATSQVPAPATRFTRKD